MTMPHRAIGCAVLAIAVTGCERAKTKLESAESDIRQAKMQHDLKATQAARQKDGAKGYWNDSRSGLQWTTESSGALPAMGWMPAVHYCRALAIAENRWRLPSREELDGIKNNKHMKPGQVTYQGESLWTSTITGRDGQAGNGYAFAYQIAAGQMVPVSLHKGEAAVVCVHKMAN